MTCETVRGVDLFCGAGGLSLGLQSAGVKIMAGVDVDPQCRWPYEHNIHATFNHASVRDLSAKDLDTLWGRGEGPRLLAGCAPCQPFSSQRRGSDTRNEEAWDLLLEFARLVEESKPTYVTMENVAPLERHPIFTDFLASLVKSGYQIHYDILRGPDFGLPQTRRRLVLVASRSGRVRLPDPDPKLARSATVKATISDLPPLNAGETDLNDPMHTARNLTDVNLDRIRNSKQGGSWQDWPEHLRAPCHRKATGESFKSFYGRMSWDLPAPTITTQFYNFGSGRFGHPDQDRAITPREASMIQGFPKDFVFVEPHEPFSFVTMGKLIGNAVPPLFGKIVGEAILEAERQRTK